MILLRAGLRVVYRRRLETASLISVVVLVVFIYGVLSLASYNLQEHVYTQMRAQLGDVAVVASLDERLLEEIAREAGASEYRAYRVALVKAYLGVVNRSAIVMALPDFDEAIRVKALTGERPLGRGEAALYRALTGGEGLIPEGVDVGSRVRVYAFKPGGVEVVDLEIVGVYRGFSWIAGNPYALVVDEGLIEELAGGGYLLASFRLEGEPGSEEIDSLADSVSRALESRGIDVYWFFVNKREENPIVNLLESAVNIVLVPASAVLAIAFLLPAAAGSVAVFRDLRSIAVVKSMGGGWMELFALYSLPWLARGLAGAAVACVLLALLADDVYFSLFVRDSEIARIMAESLGFETDYLVIARSAAYPLALVLLGSVVPLILAARADTVGALRLAEIPVARRPPGVGIPGPLLVRSQLRDAAARWWKTAGLVLVLGVLWGMTAAMEMESMAVEEVARLYMEDMPPDVYIQVRSVTPSPPIPAWKALDESLRLDPAVEAYTVFASEFVSGAITVGGEPLWMEFVYVLSGDPGVAFPLLEGRHPASGGEALISASLAEYLGVGVGDYIEVEAPSGRLERLVIVGLSKSRLNNGFYVVVGDPGILEYEPGLYEATAHVDIAWWAGEGYAGDLRLSIEAQGFLAVSALLTRGEVVEGIELLGSFIRAFYAGITAISSLGAGIVVGSIALVDASTRVREAASLMAMGASRASIIAGYILQSLVALAASAPIALASGYAIARVTAERSALALGYLEPVASIEALASPLMALAVSIVLFSTAAALSVYYGRLDLPSILRE